MVDPARQRSIRFGLFEVKPATSELFKAGRKVDLERQPFVVLSVLLEARGELVTRDELQAALWPDGSFVDFNRGLNVAVKKLRDALGDSSENPRFIETLSRRGYRFIAPIDWEQGPDTEQISEEVRPIRRLPLWIASGAAVMTGLLLYWGGWLRPFHPASVELKAIPLTSYGGYERSPALSPDGRQVAFSWDGQNRDNQDIYVKLLDTANPVRLTTDPAADDMPVWSPDGRRIAFLRTEQSKGQRTTIRILPALGGSDRELLQVAPGEFFVSGALSWSPDGEWLAFAEKTKRDEPYTLHMLSLETGERRRLTSVDSWLYGDQAPTFSPDGRSLAFVRLRTYGISDLYVLPVAGGKPTRITRNHAKIFGLSWTADGKDLVFSSSRSGGLRLWRVPASGGTPDALVGIPTADLIGGVSIRSTRMVFAPQIEDGNIWQVGVQGTKVTELPKQLIASTRDDGHPQPSPDGKRIAFTSSRSGSYEIWVSESDGQNPVQVTSTGRGENAWPTWSPDGRFIAFNSDISGNWGIYLVGSHGGKPRALAPSPAEDAGPSWSRDGKWIYFHSNRGGSVQIWKIPAQGGPPIQVTRKGGLRPSVSQDGKLIYYARDEEIWCVPADGGEEKLVLSGVLGAVDAQWAPANDGLYFRASEDTPSMLKFLNFKDGRITPVMPLDKPWALSPARLTPDGRYLLYNQIDNAGSDLMMVENFR
jgi:Tol biopolymer transport system component/DNA-binding winged helix-turn-helix (wHTH) protein